MDQIKEILNNTEKDRLVECESKIEKGLKTFIEVGEALLEIRDSRLYRETHSTFENYCRDRWNLRHQNADRIIRSAQVAGILNPIGFKISESQARELTPLKDQPEKVVEAWKEVVETTPANKVTAAHVRDIVAEKLQENKEIIDPLQDPQMWNEHTARVKEVLKENHFARTEFRFVEIEGFFATATKAIDKIVNDFSKIPWNDEQRGLLVNSLQELKGRIRQLETEISGPIVGEYRELRIVK